MHGIMSMLGTRRSMVLMTRRYTALAFAVLLPLAAACSDNDPSGRASDGNCRAVGTGMGPRRADAILLPEYPRRYGAAIRRPFTWVELH